MEDLFRVKEIQLESNSENNKKELKETEKELMQLYKVEEEY